MCSTSAKECWPVRRTSSRTLDDGTPTWINPWTARWGGAAGGGGVRYLRDVSGHVREERRSGARDDWRRNAASSRASSAASTGTMNAPVNSTDSLIQRFAGSDDPDVLKAVEGARRARADRELDA